MHSTTPDHTPQMFDFKGQQVRVVTHDDGEPRWVAADIAKILEYRNTPDMNRHVDDEDKGVAKVHTPGGAQTMTVLNESGLYSAILRSSKPEAKAFKRWVTREVLPSIRKHGAYLTEQRIEQILTDPDTIIQLATDLKEERARAERLETELTEAAPKAEAYDAFMDADGTYSIGNVAKMIGMSQNKLFDTLRNKGVLIAKGAMRNTPYQRYMHHFAVKAYEYERSNGERGTSYTTRVQPSGVDFIRRKVSQPTLQAVTA